MKRIVLALLLASACAMQAAAAPLYSMTSNTGLSKNSVAPFRFDSTVVTFASGGAEGHLSYAAFAAEASVGATVGAILTNHAFSGGYNPSLWPKATTTDLVISGPGGSYVTGTMNLRFRATVSGSGGADGCRSDAQPWIVIAGSNYYTGGFRFTNQAGYPPYQAWGVLLGAHPSSSIDTVLKITRTWPVGTPFSIEVGIISSVTASVNSAAPACSWTCDMGGSGASGWGAGLTMGDETGLVMTLPAGYALSSASWHIGNNHLNTVAGVGDGGPPAAAFALAGATPNPSRGAHVTLAFALSDAAPATLELLDVAGRRVATRDVGALGAGRHTVGLSPAQRLAPGLYLARLTRAGERRVARVCVVE